MHVVQYHKDKESASIMDDGIYTAVFRHNIRNWFSIPMQELPIGIANTGDTCFAGALLQCLSTVTMPANVLEQSCDAPDQLVASVHAKQVTCNTAVMYMKTPLIREIYDADMGYQGQQCPMQFYSTSCKKGGIIAESFNTNMSEVLKCGSCTSALNMPQLSSDNHIQILKFDTNTTASTLTELVLKNILSGRIEGYTPTAHMTKFTQERPCENNHGAFHVLYFSSTLPQHLCFALASIIEDTALKNTRYFAPQLTIILPELNTLSPPNSQDTKHAQYQLFGTVVHTGNSPQTGHFSAYVLITTGFSSMTNMQAKCHHIL